MPNVFPNLDPTIVSQMAIDAVGNSLAYLQDFTTDFSDEIIDARRSTVTVPFVSGGSVAIVNPTTFGGGNTGIVKVPVVTEHLHIPFYITNAEYQNGFKLEQLIKSNVQVLLNTIQAKAFAPVTVANYGAAFTVAEASFTSGHLLSAFAAVKGSDKGLYLAPTSYAKAGLVGTSNQVVGLNGGTNVTGFTRGAKVIDVTTGLGSNVYGFVFSGNSGIAMASGKAGIAPRAASMIDSIDIQLGSGLVATLNIWGDTSDRSDNASLDLYFGAAKADPNAIRCITSA